MRAIRTSAALILAGLLASGATYAGETDSQTAALPSLARESTVASLELQQAAQRLRTAEEALREARLDAAEDARTSPQFIGAQAELAEAQRNYKLTRQQIVSELEQKAEYRKLIERKEAIGEQVDRLRGSASEQTLINLAELKLQFATQASQMEIEALAESPQFQQAQQQLMEAEAQLAAARNQLDQRIADDPQLALARQRYEQAQELYSSALKAYVGSEAAYRQAIENRDYLFEQLEDLDDDYYPRYRYRPPFSGTAIYPWGWNFNFAAPYIYYPYRYRFPQKNWDWHKDRDRDWRRDWRREWREDRRQDAQDDAMEQPQLQQRFWPDGRGQLGIKSP